MRVDQQDNTGSHSVQTEVALSSKLPAGNARIVTAGAATYLDAQVLVQHCRLSAMRNTPAQPVMSK